MEEKHLLFVYGTLRKNLGNDHILNGGIPRNLGGHDLGPTKMVSMGKTLEPFYLYASAHPIVCKEALNSGDTAAFIVGEVWEVAQERLEGPLDSLEAHPRWYIRELIEIEMEDGTTIEAWIYFMPNDRVRDPERWNNIPSGDYMDDNQARHRFERFSTKFDDEY